MASPHSNGRRDSAASQASSEASARSKVPIPRLKRQHTKGREDGNGGGAGGAATGGAGAAVILDKHRVSHACEPCRQRKTKCSGERPHCRHCQDFKIACYYADGKRDRAKNEMMRLKNRVDNYEKLLEQLISQVDSGTKLAITNALQGLPFMDVGDPEEVRVRDGESLAPGDAGSTGALDHIKEEVNPDNSPFPMGYMGKSSEVAWIQRVAQQLTGSTGRESPPSSFSPTFSPREYSYPFPNLDQPRSYEELMLDEYHIPAYHLDDLSLSAGIGQIDPYNLPEKKLADNLIDAYFQTIHNSFPIVSQKVFMEQYETFFQTFFPPNSSRKWLAMLNLQFALGALYARLTNAEWKGSDTEHLRFFGRARMLYLDEGCILEVADLQHVQVIGLAGMYLLASNQTNRAWNTIGLAIRYAQTLGLNLRNNVYECKESTKELPTRIWYALYSVEHMLCFMTGRPSSIRDKDCSTPLPRPIDEDACVMDAGFDAALQQYSEDYRPSPSAAVTPRVDGFSAHSASPTGSELKTPVSEPRRLSYPITQLRSPYPQSPAPELTGFKHDSRYFLEHTKLSRITAAILSELYRPDTARRSWSEVQGCIASLELRISKWKSDLPPQFDFDRNHWDQEYLRDRERMALEFQYHNARILVNKPCLFRAECQIQNESSRSRAFNRSAAAACVGSARETVSMLPKEINGVALMSMAPWWCLLHYLVSAGTILMLEISMRAEHNPQKADALLMDAKQLVRWLRALSVDNIAAMRSWTVLSKLLIATAPKIGGDTSDIERDLEISSIAEQNHLNQQQSQQQQQLQQLQQGLFPVDEELYYEHYTHSAALEFGVGVHENGQDGMQDGFHGFLENTAPFGFIPHRTTYNNPMPTPGTLHTTPTELAFRPSFDGGGSAISPGQQVMVTVVSNIGPNGVVGGDSGGGGGEGDSAVGCNGDRSGSNDERAQKRISRGVDSITMPLRMTFGEWSTGISDDFMLGTLTGDGDGAERGREDMRAAEDAVNTNNETSPTAPEQRSRKRGGPGAGAYD